jgi:hypothetical protein
MNIFHTVTANAHTSLFFDHRCLKMASGDIHRNGTPSPTLIVDT